MRKEVVQMCFIIITLLSIIDLGILLKVIDELKGQVSPIIYVVGMILLCIVIVVGIALEETDKKDEGK